MARLEACLFGMLESCCHADGTPYSKGNFRTVHEGQTGLLKVYVSERKTPGKKFIYFFPNAPQNIFQNYLHSSTGNLKQNGNLIVLTTENSEYRFRIEPMSVSEGDKRILLSNTFKY